MKRTLSRQIEDVIFVPSSENHTVRNIFLVIVSILILVYIGSLISRASDNTQKTPQQQLPETTFPVSNLAISGYSMEWVGQQLYFKGTIKNSDSRTARNVYIRLDFYNDKDSKDLFDTRYVTLAGVINNGAYTFSEYVPIASRTQQFWYTYKIISASF